MIGISHNLTLSMRCGNALESCTTHLLFVFRKSRRLGNHDLTQQCISTIAAIHNLSGEANEPICTNLSYQPRQIAMLNVMQFEHSAGVAQFDDGRSNFPRKNRGSIPLETFFCQSIFTVEYSIYFDASSCAAYSTVQYLVLYTLCCSLYSTTPAYR